MYSASTHELTCEGCGRTTQAGVIAVSVLCSTCMAERYSRTCSAAAEKTRRREADAPPPNPRFVTLIAPEGPLPPVPLTREKELPPRLRRLRDRLRKERADSSSS